ncbi:MAG TPA: RNA methyltransferase [Pontiella sp.]
MTKEITSAANPFIKQLKALASSKKVRQETDTFIIEGWRSIKTLLAHESQRYRLEQLIISSEWVKDSRIPDSIETIHLSDHLFEKISDVRNAQGILGVVRSLPNPFNPSKCIGNYLLLDNLRDPGNLGTLIRSAVGAGFKGVLLYGDCVEPFNPKVIRSTMGTFAFCNIWIVGSEEIEQMMQAGYELCVTTGAGGDSLYKTRFSKNNILVIGSEAHGVSENLMMQATKKITIPLSEECESLNAAIAGSICMFEITKDQS